MDPSVRILPTGIPQLFDINLEEVSKCAAELGVTKPIAIYFTARNARNYGSYVGYGRSVPFGPKRRPLSTPHHFIALHPRITARSAAETIAHELVHARQCEKEYGGDWQTFFNAYSDDLKKLRAYSASARSGSAGHSRYGKQRHEVEAFRLAPELADRYDLVQYRGKEIS
jgi:hypothetical protein